MQTFVYVTGVLVAALAAGLVLLCHNWRPQWYYDMRFEGMWSGTQAAPVSEPEEEPLSGDPLRNCAACGYLWFGTELRCPRCRDQRVRQP